MVTVERDQDAIRKLATYLRHNPGALSSDPEAVASASGVPVDLVRRSLTQPRGVPPVIDEGPAGPGFFEQLRTRTRGIFNFFDRYLFLSIGLSVVVTALIVLALVATSPPKSGFDARDVIAIAIVGLAVTFHLLLYFRRGHTRIAFFGALVVWLTSSAILGVGAIVSGQGIGQAFAVWIVGTLGLMFLCMMYSGVGAAAALMGAYRVVKSEEATKKNRTRQQLIERMFEIEEHLGKQSEALEDETWFRRFLVFGQRNVWLLALGASLVLSVLGEGLGLFRDLPARGLGLTVLFMILSIIIAASTFVSQVVLAFMGGRPSRSIFVSLVFTAVQVGVGFIPPFNKIGKLGEFEPYFIGFTLLFQWGLAVLIGLFAGIGAKIEEQSYRRKRLEQNDPQMLLAELIDIQRILNPDTSTQFLMVVDAARSSVMKANADPMQAEWSFREYQMFLARIVEANGGRIHSTAGDGAIAIFNSAPAAFQAAREIQTKISDFNLNVSRLKDPFRLRIGIHSDTVQGDLEDVQFAAVIDIAAHVEGASQVGGIAVTQPVAEHLPDHRFAVLSDLVDGYVVSMALNPTLDPDA